MKHFYGKILTIVFCILVISGCKSLFTNAIINIEADNTSNAVDLKLSDMADSFKIINLETTNESMLNDLTEYYYNENYILAWSEKGVFKFSSSGKFIKKLIGIGRGPNEFVNLSLCILTIDQNNDILYINDQMHNGLYFRYDLKSEQFIEPIKQCFPSFGSFDIENDSLIIVSNVLNPKYAVYYQDFDGEFISGIANTKKMLSGQKETLQRGRLVKSGSNYYYSFLYDDTLFKIKDDKLIPYLALNFEDSRGDPPKIILKNGFERLIVFQSIGPGFFIILVWIDNFKYIDLNNRATGKGKSYYLLLNNLKGKASRINSYSDNFIGESKDVLALSNIDFLSPFFLKLSPNKRIIIPYWPYQIKKAIEKGLNYKDFPAEINDQLLRINKTLHETDNPILLIGMIKDRI